MISSIINKIKTWFVPKNEIINNEISIPEQKPQKQDRIVFSMVNGKIIVETLFDSKDDTTINNFASMLFLLTNCKLNTHIVKSFKFEDNFNEMLTVWSNLQTQYEKNKKVSTVKKVIQPIDVLKHIVK